MRWSRFSSSLIIPREVALHYMLVIAPIPAHSPLHSHELFPVLNLKHPLFDGVPRDEAVDFYFLVLTHAMDSVDGLRLDSKTPPGVHHEDALCLREVQPHATGSQANQQDGEFVGLPELVQDRSAGLLV